MIKPGQLSQRALHEVLPLAQSFRICTLGGIPVKANIDSGGKPNGIPE